MTEDALADVQSAGRWLPWAGFGIALMWWAAAGTLAYLHFGLEAILAADPALTITLALLGILPGLLIILGASLAGENIRANRANRLVLASSARLIQPARAVLSDAQSLSADMRRLAEGLEASMDGALAKAQAAARELGDERQRMESVSYACADNARDLVTRLSEERRSIETLARELRVQLDALNEAIPKQAEMMVSAARDAAGELGRADEVLEQRLDRLRATAEDMKSVMLGMNAEAGDAEARQAEYAMEVKRLSDSLERARGLSEQALKAGEMASAAATDTAAALREAVADAIETAHAAAQDIRAARAHAPPTTAAQPEPEVKPVTEPVKASRRPDTPSQPAPKTPLPDVDEALFEDGEAAKPVIHPRETDRAGERIALPAVAAEPGTLTGNGASLRDILADIDRSDLEEEPTADSGLELVTLLEESGIELPKIFRPKDGKRIAQAARKSTDDLRKAVRSIAAGEVQRVAARLKRNEDMLDLARDFMMVDGERVMKTLIGKPGDAPASLERISAYLLIDAALR